MELLSSLAAPIVVPLIIHSIFGGIGPAQPGPDTPGNDQVQTQGSSLSSDSEADSAEGTESTGTAEATEDADSNLPADNETEESTAASESETSEPSEPESESEPAVADATTAKQVSYKVESASANAPEPEVVEQHVFNGSGTEVAAFQDWFAGNDFNKPSITTRDLQPLLLPNGDVAQAGDTIAQLSTGEYTVVGQA